MIVFTSSSVYDYEITNVSFSQQYFKVSNTFPEVNADITLYNRSTYEESVYTIPLTKQVTSGLDFSYKGLKDFYLNFTYMGRDFNYFVDSELDSNSNKLLRGIRVIDANDYYHKETFPIPDENVRFTPRESSMKVTSEPGAVPTIIIDIAYIWRISAFYDWETHLTDTLILTKDSILNEEYLDFSVPGSKIIKFNYEGIEEQVTIDFYDVDITDIKSIDGIENITIYKGENVIDKLYEVHNGKTLTIHYYESKNGIFEKKIQINDRQFIIDHFDISNFVENETGLQPITFKYVEGKESGYTELVSVNVLPREEDSVEYLYNAYDFNPSNTFSTYMYFDELTNELYVTKVELHLPNKYIDNSGKLKQEVLDDPNLKQEALSKYYQKVYLSSLSAIMSNSLTLSVDGYNNRTIYINDGIINDSTNIDIKVYGYVDENTGVTKWKVLDQIIDPVYTPTYSLTEDGYVSACIVKEDGTTSTILERGKSFVYSLIESFNSEIRTIMGFGYYTDYITLSLDENGCLVVTEKENIPENIRNSASFIDLVGANGEQLIKAEMAEDEWQYTFRYMSSENIIEERTSTMYHDFVYTIENEHLLIDGIQTTANVKPKITSNGSSQNITYGLYYTDSNGNLVQIYCNYGSASSCSGLINNITINENQHLVFEGRRKEDDTHDLVDSNVLVKGSIIDYADDKLIYYDGAYVYYDIYKEANGVKVIKAYNLIRGSLGSDVKIDAMTPELLEYFIDNGLYSYLVLDSNTKEVYWYEEQQNIPTNTNPTVVKETKYQVEVSEDAAVILNAMGVPQTTGILTLCDDGTARCDLFGNESSGFFYKNDSILCMDYLDDLGLFFELTDPENKIFTVKLGLTSDPTKIVEYTFDETNIHDMFGDYKQLISNSLLIDQEGNGFIKLVYQTNEFWSQDGNYNTSGNWYNSDKAPENPIEKTNNTYYLDLQSEYGEIYLLAKYDNNFVWEHNSSEWNVLSLMQRKYTNWQWIESIPTDAPADESSCHVYVNSYTKEIYEYDFVSKQWNTYDYSILWDDKNS